MKVKLTDKQKIFVKEYLVDLNATQAAIRAGYSIDTAKQIACENLSKPYLQDAIGELMEERSKKIDVDSQWVLKRLVKINDRCLEEEEIEKWDYDEKKLIGTGTFKFDSSGANKSAELIGKHLAMFTDKIDTTVTMDKKPVDELVESIEGLKNENNTEVS